MNILILTTHYPSAAYDNKLTKMTHYFAREWVRCGHGVRVVHAVDGFFTDKTGDITKVSKEPFEVEGVRAIELPAPRYLPRFSYLLPATSRRLARDTGRFLDGEGFVPDAMIVDFCVPLWDFARIVHKRYGCRILPIFHNCDLDYLLSPRLVTRICEYCDIVGVRSRTIGECVASFGCDTPQVLVKSGAPDSIFDEAEQPSQHRDGEPYRLIYVGKMIERKNVDTIIRALAQLRGRYSFTLDIVGEGECEPSLRQLTTDLRLDNCVRFLGTMPRAQVLERMAESDCFVMTSRSETFGIVYIEAMACRCYVIGSRGEGIDGVLIDGVNGALVAPGDVDELRDALAGYFDMNADERAAIVSRAYDDAHGLTESAVASELLGEILKER